MWFRFYWWLYLGKDAEVAQEESVRKGDERLRDHDRDDFDRRIEEVRGERHGELLWYSQGSCPSFFRLSFGHLHEKAVFCTPGDMAKVPPGTPRYFCMDVFFVIHPDVTSGSWRSLVILMGAMTRRSEAESRHLIEDHTEGGGRHGLPRTTMRAACALLCDAVTADVDWPKLFLCSPWYWPSSANLVPRPTFPCRQRLLRWSPSSRAVFLPSSSPMRKSCCAATWPCWSAASKRNVVCGQKTSPDIFPTTFGHRLILDRIGLQ